MPDGGFSVGGLNQTHDVAVNTAVGTTAALNVRGVKSATIFIPAGSSINSLAFHASATFEKQGSDGLRKQSNDTYLPLSEFTYDDEDSAEPVYAALPITLTVAHTNAYRLPDALFPCAGLKMVGNAAGTVTIHTQF